MAFEDRRVWTPNCGDWGRDEAVLGLGCQGPGRGIIDVNLGANLGQMLDRADWHCPWAKTAGSPD